MSTPKLNTTFAALAALLLAGPLAHAQQATPSKAPDKAKRSKTSQLPT